MQVSPDFRTFLKKSHHIKVFPIFYGTTLTFKFLYSNMMGFCDLSGHIWGRSAEVGKYRNIFRK